MSSPASSGSVEGVSAYLDLERARRRHLERRAARIALARPLILIGIPVFLGLTHYAWWAFAAVAVLAIAAMVSGFWLIRRAR